jgi:hypothetical protein
MCNMQEGLPAGFQIYMRLFLYVSDQIGGGARVSYSSRMDADGIGPIQIFTCMQGDALCLPHSQRAYARNMQ